MRRRINGLRAAIGAGSDGRRHKRGLPTTIGYYFDEPSRRLRPLKWYRAGLLALLLIGATTMAFQQRTRLLRVFWEKSCSKYELTPGLVVLESDEQRAGSLLRSNRSYRPIAVVGRSSPAAVLTSSRLESLCKFETGLLSTGATVYMHERWTTEGRRMLVIVQTGERGFPSVASFYAASFELSTVNAGAPRYSLSQFDVELDRGPGGSRVFAGQTDREDRSKFFISYEDRRGRGTVVGTLTEGGVDLKLGGSDGVSP